MGGPGPLLSQTQDGNRTKEMSSESILESERSNSPHLGQYTVSIPKLANERELQNASATSVVFLDEEIPESYKQDDFDSSSTHHYDSNGLTAMNDGNETNQYRSSSQLLGDDNYFVDQEEKSCEKVNNDKNLFFHLTSPFDQDINSPSESSKNLCTPLPHDIFSAHSNLKDKFLGDVDIGSPPNSDLWNEESLLGLSIRESQDCTAVEKLTFEAHIETEPTPTNCENEAREIYKSAHPSAYAEFLQRLKSPDCMEVVDSLKRFVFKTRIAARQHTSRLSKIATFLNSSRLSKEDIAYNLHSFIEEIVERLVNLVPSFSEDVLKTQRSLLVPAQGITCNVDLNALKKAGNLVNGNDEEFDENSFRMMLAEQCERFLTSKLHPVLSCVMDREKEHDIALQNKLDWMNQWIQPLHLDICNDIESLLCRQRQMLIHPECSNKREKHKPSSRCDTLMSSISESSLPETQSSETQQNGVVSANSNRIEGTWLDLGIEQLNKLSTVKSPKALLTLLLNLCQIASDLAVNLCRSQNKLFNSAQTKVMIAADDLLPILIWLIIRIRPKNIVYSIEFISTFRLPTLLVSKDLYYFTMINSAVEFVLRLKAFSDLRIQDSTIREICIRTCPSNKVANWIGEINKIASKEESPPMSTEALSTVVVDIKDVPSGITDSQLPPTTHISSLCFNQDVYQKFLVLLRRSDCNECVSYLKRFVNTAVSNEKNAKDDNFLRPDKIQSVISLGVRMLTRNVSDLTWNILVDAEQLHHKDDLKKQRQSSDVSSKAEVDRFNKKFAQIVVLTECIERFIFGKISQLVFHRIVKALEESHRRTHDKQGTDNFSNRGLFRNIFAPFSSASSDTIHNKSRESSTLVGKQPIEENSNLGTSHFFLSSAVLTIRSHLGGDAALKNALCHKSTDKMKAVDYTRKLFQLLNTLKSPLEKLTCFIKICHLASALAESEHKAGNETEQLLHIRSSIIAEVAELFILAPPMNIEANLDFVMKYRHPILLSPEVMRYLLIIRVARMCVTTLAERQSVADCNLKQVRKWLREIVSMRLKNNVHQVSSSA